MRIRAKTKILGTHSYRLEPGNSYRCGDTMTAAPALWRGAGTKIRYVVATRAGRVVALDRKLNKLWDYKLQDEHSFNDKFRFDDSAMAIQESPTLADLTGDGRPEVVFGADNGTLCALSSQGKELWTFKTEGAMRTSPLVADVNSDGKPEVIASCTDGHLYVLGAEGRQLTSFQAESGIASSPSLMRLKKDTAVVFGSDEGRLYAINAKCHELWSFMTGGKIVCMPVVARLFGDERQYIIAGSCDGRLYCLSSSGTLVWSHRTDGAIVSSVCVQDLDRDGQLEVVFGSSDGRVYALSADGSVRWEYDIGSWVGSRPAVGDLLGNGEPCVVVGAYDGSVRVLESRGRFSSGHLPGISGVVQQTGYHDFLTPEFGELTCDQLCSMRMDSMVTSTTPGAAKNEFMVGTGDGVLHQVFLRAN